MDLSGTAVSVLPFFGGMAPDGSRKKGDGPVQSLCAQQPHIVLGITSAQTAVVLAGRVRDLAAKGFRVTVLSGPGEQLDNLLRNEGGDAIRVPMRRMMAPPQDAVSLFRIWRALRRARPDVVEFSTPKAGLLGMLASVLAGVPRRVYMLRGLKLETARGPKRAILWAAEWLTMRCAHTVLANSASLRTNALDLGLVRADRIRLLGQGSSIGVDTTHFAPATPGTDARERMRRKLGLPLEARVIGFAGRLTRDKGLPELLEAFEAVARREPQARLLLVGWWDKAEDALDPALRERIERDPRIVVTGFVVDTAPYYRAMDLFVLPTLREGFPNAVLEASASALPVITTLSTGARDAVIAEVTGLLVPPECAEAVAEMMLRLVEDPALRARMGAAGRRWVIQHYERTRVLDENAAFYKEMLQEPERGSRAVAGPVAAPVRSVMDWSA